MQLQGPYFLVTSAVICFRWVSRINTSSWLHMALHIFLVITHRHRFVQLPHLPQLILVIQKNFIQELHLQTPHFNRLHRPTAALYHHQNAQAENQVHHHRHQEIPRTSHPPNASGQPFQADNYWNWSGNSVKICTFQG